MYSFDVFDTLITRTTANPWGIFSLIRDKLRKEQEKSGLDDYVIDNFYELRIHSEELVRKAISFQNREEVTLYDIYQAMAVCGSLDQAQIMYLCSAEEETEIANVIGIARNIDRLKTLLKLGEKVVLVSDMYLSKETIRRMLMKADEVFCDIPLYVSSEYGRRKTTGNLYRQVQKLEQVGYNEWTHIGDNLYQDIEIPCLLGVRVELVEREELSNFEQQILESYGDDSALQLLIGSVLRGERESYKYMTDWKKSGIKDTRRRRSAWHIGCRYAGPILYSYAEWIVDQTVKKGIERLYFIARDGYLIKEIVDIILSVKNIDVETKYIYGSRMAWRIPSLTEEHYNLYQLILWSHIHRIKTLKELANVLHISLQGLYEYLPGVYAKDKGDIRISNQELEYIAEKLSENDSFKKYHLGQLADERKLVQQYLEQEVNVSDDRFAFVDVSGGGLTQGCLRELLKDRYNKPIHTFFFKIDRVNLVENSITDTFMPGFLENNLTIEMICRAPHGQTKGYFRKDGRIVPDCEVHEREVLLEYGFREYEEGILAFSRRMLEVSESCGRKIGSIRNVLLYLKHIAQEPTEDVLEYFASMPSSESGRGGEVVEYAPRLSEYDIKEIFLRRTNEPLEYFYKGTDLNYSCMRASENEKMLIARCKKEHDSALGKLYRQEEEVRRRRLTERYGRAAFYPVRLLEEKIILYGAGKFGQDLYARLKDDPKHEVVLWVDKNTDLCQKKGLHEVCSVSEMNCPQAADVQVVIAVMVEAVADEIRKELEQFGILADRIIWLESYPYPDAIVRWRSEKIG